LIAELREVGAAIAFKLFLGVGCAGAESQRRVKNVELRCLDPLAGGIVGDVPGVIAEDTGDSCTNGRAFKS
jgi:hypothetical protein